MNSESAYFCGVKKAMATLICLCLIAQCLIQLSVAGYYELNRSSFARILIAHHDQPRVKCCGKCYLRHQLRQAADRSEESRDCPGRPMRQEEAFFVMPAAVLIPVSLLPGAPSKCFNPGDQDMHHHLPLHAVFRPPILAG